ncbi:hypothetical protein [Desulfatitalea tepidiphila]|uniref:hypothetical protein n=1 Tax=Desulfatitalea tepidiphila TaxID=1185843 RepID=UPI0013793068|nr:hypothetical protein [Desulfatitalea tepidiphila]
MRKKIYTRNVGVMLTEQCYQRLVDITDNLEVTVSAYIRDLLQKEIDQKEENLNA